MWKFVKCIDTLMLESAQSFCDTVQRAVGYTKFTISKWILILVVLFLVTGILLSIQGVPFSQAVILYCVLAWDLWVACIGVRRIELDGRYFHQYGKSPHPSVFRHDTRLRGIFVGSSALFALFSGVAIEDGIRQWLFVCTFLSCIAFVYVEACIPRPPSQSRFREWVKKKVEEWSPRRLLPT